ncbi:hypothetical protein GF336_07065 [Candidatus Woesearchaeota archaeon]|nr:hypothetical protein [Candidatus Woesearchaeota archaeon]
MAIRKSQVSIQFSWIFILIAGAIILLFFIGIVYKQKDVSETRLSATLLKQLDPILSGAQLEEQALNEIDITSPAAMQFVCDGDESFYSIGDARKPTPTKIVFAPSEIESQKLITWTQVFNKPFKVANLFYLTSPTVRYIFDDSRQSTDFLEMIPEEIETIQCDSTCSNINDEGHDKERLISFSGNPSIPSNIAGKDVSKVSISDSTITFYDSDGTSDSSLTIDDSTKLGAIFSEDKETYDCNMNKLLEKYKLIAAIYAEKESELSEHFTNDPECSFFYGNNAIGLSDYLQTCQSIDECNQINDFSGQISDDNQRLLQQSCPLIY